MTSIRTKLLLGLLIPLIIVAAFVSLETFFASRKISQDLSDKTLLAASLTILERVISTNGNLLAEETLDTLTENLGDRFFYHVSGPNGAFVTGYSGYPRPPTSLEVAQDQPYYYDGVHLGEPVRVVLLRRDFSDRELSGVTAITTWQRITQRDSLTFSLFARSLTRLALLVLAAGTIVWFAVRYGLNPLIRLQDAIDRRTPYDLNPIRRSMPPELSGIVASMNDLFQRVARSKNNRERFIGDAAHQLRNPIAAIKVQAELALSENKKTAMEEGLRQIVDVSNASTSMINKMLSSASAYALDQKSESVFDLSAVVRETVSDAASSAFEKDQEISLVGAEEVTNFQGSSTLIREAIVNLIDNAIRYNSRGSEIEVGLLIGDEMLEIFVADSGKPWTEEEFLTLTQPFYTEQENSTGTGLGLSIAKDIAKSHGGYLATQAMLSGKKISIHLACSKYQF